MINNHEFEQSVGEDLMNRWDSLETEIAALREREDIRLFVLLQDFDRWQLDQQIEWNANPDGTFRPNEYVYLSTNEQNQPIQLILTPPNPEYLSRVISPTYEFTIIEQLVDPQNPSSVSEVINGKETDSVRWYAREEYKDAERKGDEEVMSLWEPDMQREVHEIDLINVIGTTFFRGVLGKAQHGSHKTLGNSLVVYQRPDDLNVNLLDPDTIRIGYGRTNRIVETWRAAMGGRGGYMYLPQELVRKLDQDPAKRLDPIDVGRRTLGLLQRATLLGRFDTRTGGIIQPHWTQRLLEG